MKLDEPWTDKLACRELVETSVRHVDRGDARAFADLFTSDGVLVRPGGQLLEGREAIFQAYAARPPERMTRHLVTNVAFEPVDATRLAARSYVLLVAGSTQSKDGPWGRPMESRQLIGEFVDQLVRSSDGSWRIQRREAYFVFHSN